MNISKRDWFYFSVVAFPVFFVLHALNEQFGLLRGTVIIELLGYYVAVAIGVAIVSRLLFKNDERAAVFSFLLLCIFFFFGAVKDVLKSTQVISFAASYRVFIPLLVVLLFIAFVAVNKTTFPLVRANLFIRTLLIVCVVIEMGALAYNFSTGKQHQRDLGDIDHSLLKQMRSGDPAVKPDIFWIILDEYAGSTGLKSKWNFTNPLDSMLASRNFFVADSARSPYNYTHYSLVSTLDMQYLNSLQEHSFIGFRDIVRGNISLRSTNVVKFLEQNGYNIFNQTIYNVDGHPTQAREYFINADWKLVDNQTLPGRIRQDLGWNVKNFFTGNRRATDSVEKAEAFVAEADYRLQLVHDGLTGARQAFKSAKPTFFMFHYMLTHEPFIYNKDGSISSDVGFDVYPERYIPAVNYANNVITGLIDSIMTAAQGRNFVIIVQGDHGYKFDEQDPLFDSEGCSILYAVYCSDTHYPGYTRSFNSVNGFRVLFNKYFHTNLTILENRSTNLLYR